MGHAEVDQARFLAAGHHFDLVAECGFGREQEVVGLPQRAHGVGGDRAHAVARNRGQALAEAFQAVVGAKQRLFRQAALAVQPLGQAHVFLELVHDAQLPEHGPRNHHVEAVRSQVHRRQQFAIGDGGACRTHGENRASSAAWAE